jgi:hypothetical protein
MKTEVFNEEEEEEGVINISCASTGTKDAINLWGASNLCLDWGTGTGAGRRYDRLATVGSWVRRAKNGRGRAWGMELYPHTSS